MLKALSIIGYLGMAGGLIAQWATGNLLSSSPLVIAVHEEVMVTARYPEYRQYAATTWRMFPYVF